MACGVEIVAVRCLPCNYVSIRPWPPVQLVCCSRGVGRVEADHDAGWCQERLLGVWAPVREL